MKRIWTRRAFLKTALFAGTLSWAGCATTRTTFDRMDCIFPSYQDEKTGAKVYNLTPGKTQDTIVYQTHPMWTRDMEYLVFMSDGVVSALEMATGIIRPLPETTTNFSMQWNSGNLFFLRERNLYGVDIPSLVCGAAKPELVGGLPASYPASRGGLSVDATGDTVYAGVMIEEEKRWGVAGFSKNGSRLLTTVDFPVGHIQAHPSVAGKVMFCWETGGDSPQRTWLVDGNDDKAHPAYTEQYNEWVTHEVWWGRDRIIFTIWPYDEEHSQKPHGVACTNCSEGRLDVLAQYPAWHAHGSPDGRWALGDDFDRNIWLINMATRERRLLTQGHLGAGFKTHPHASFTPDSRAIVLNSSHSGSEDIFLVPVPEWETLPVVS